VRRSEPDEVLFVIDAMIGQAAVETARAFQDGVDFTGVVLTKLDGDARGGAALSVAKVTGRPIMFASTGEGVKDFEVFHPDRMASRILDMGDMLTLIEQAERAFDKQHADEMERKFLAAEDFTFDDFLQQMAAIKKMGSLKSMLGMMPGMQPDAGPARRLRRARVRPGRGDGPLDDPVRAQPPQADQRLAPGPHRQGVGHQRDRGQPAARALRRGPEDDEAARSRRRAGDAGACRACPGAQAKAAPPPRRKGKSGNPAKRAAEQKAPSDGGR
jgi:signal recognition particle subunit SRP54